MGREGKRDKVGYVTDHFGMPVFSIGLIPLRFGISAQLYNTFAQRLDTAGRSASNQSSASFHKGTARGRK